MLSFQNSTLGTSKETMIWYKDFCSLDGVPETPEMKVFRRLPDSGTAQRGPVEWDIVLKAPPWLGYNTTPRSHRDDGEVSAVVLPHCVQQQCAPWPKTFHLVLVLSTFWSCQDLSTLVVVLNGADTTHCHQRDDVEVYTVVVLPHCMHPDRREFKFVRILILPKCIYSPIPAMRFLAMFTFQLDNNKRQTLSALRCRNGSCRYVQALSLLLELL